MMHGNENGAYLSGKKLVENGAPFFVAALWNPRIQSDVYLLAQNAV
jgi:hypothetical protein